MLGLSDMGLGCVPPMVRCECWACLFDMILGCVPPMSDVSAGWAILTSFIPWSSISAEDTEYLNEG